MHDQPSIKNRYLFYHWTIIMEFMFPVQSIYFCCEITYTVHWGSKWATQKTAFVPDNLSLEFCEMDFVYIQKGSKLFAFNPVLVMESWKRWVLLYKYVFLAYST